MNVKDVQILDDLKTLDKLETAKTALSTCKTRIQASKAIWDKEVNRPLLNKVTGFSKRLAVVVHTLVVRLGLD